jgi:hypothetical protein
MSRRIETGTKDPVLGVNQEPEGALGRLVKYIPAEIVALYLAVSGPIPKADVTTLWWVFGLCAIITPFYLLFATKDKIKGFLWVQVILGTIAFPVWVFAIGGPFLSLPWYKGYIASVVLTFVTFAFARIKPAVGS